MLLWLLLACACVCVPLILCNLQLLFSNYFSLISIISWPVYTVFFNFGRLRTGNYLWSIKWNGRDNNLMFISPSSSGWPCTHHALHQVFALQTKTQSVKKTQTQLVCQTESSNLSSCVKSSCKFMYCTWKLQFIILPISQGIDVLAIIVRAYCLVMCSIKNLLVNSITQKKKPNHWVTSSIYNT